MAKDKKPLNQDPKPNNGMLRSGLITGSMTFISRLAGVARDTIIGQVFGAQAATDAFIVAFRIPNLFRRLFAEGAFSQAFVPVFSEYKVTKSNDELRDLAAHVFGTLGTVLLMVTTLGVCAAPLIILLFAPGFADDVLRTDLATQMLTITFPYLFFISLVACAGGMLNSFKRFAVPAFTPVFLNLSMIAAALWLSPHMQQPIIALAWGVFIAGIAQFLFQLPFLWRLNLLARPRFSWNHPGVKHIRKLMLPAIFGSSVAQINLLLDTVIASFLAAGSVSWLYFSDRMVEFPMGVFGIALATVVLPHLSSQHAKNDNQGFADTLAWAVRLVLYIAVPATLGLLLLAEPIIASIFQYREFTLNDTQMAGYSLFAYALGLPAFVLVKILASAFYAQQDTRTPVRFAVIALISNAILNLALVLPMLHFEFVAPHMGLAFATAASSWLNAGLLYRGLKKNALWPQNIAWAKHFFRVIVAATAMSLLLLYFTADVVNWGLWSFQQRITNLLGLIFVAMLVYLACLFASGTRLRDFSN